MILDSNGSSTTDEQFIVENSGITCRRILKAGQGLDTNTIDTNTDVNLTFSRNGNEFLRLDKTNDNITCSKEIVAGGGIKNNAFDSDGDSDVLFKRNDIQFMALDKFIEDTLEKEAITCSKQLRANGNILVRKLQINQFPVGIEYCDFRLPPSDSVMRFYVGKGSNTSFTITNHGVDLGRVATCSSGLKTNTIDTATDADLIVRRNGTTFLTLDDTDGVKASQSITVEGASDCVFTNNLRHNTGTELNVWTLSTMKFYSNAINKMEIKQTQIDFNEDVFVADGKGIRVPEIFTYNYDTYSVLGVTGDVVWAYDNNAYMFYDASDTRFSLMVDVFSNFEFSGTAFNVVSVEWRKENIEDVDEDCSEIVKD